MLKSVIKQCCPPIIWQGVRQAASITSHQTNADEPALFDGDDALFVQSAKDARVYGEYGMGLSTAWIDTNTKAQIIAVDTSSVWVNTTLGTVKRQGHILRHIDLGPVGDWGFPQTFARRHDFVNYAEGIWSHTQKPTVVLIDGRFRVACFLTSLLRAEPGCCIIFDDYTNREAYHIVEEFLKPEQRNARQAVFVVPDRIDVPRIQAERDRFLWVKG